MKPVDQTRFGKDGDYMAACTASIFEVGIDEAPDLNADRVDDWWCALTDWCGSRGLVPVCLGYSDDLIQELGETWMIVSGKSIRGLKHATVWQNGRLIHDPHPSRDGLVKQGEIVVFVAMDPVNRSGPVGMAR